MSVAKVIELSAQSPKSFDAAIDHGIERAQATLDGVQSVWVKDMQVVLKDGKPDQYRVNLKTTFEVKSGN